MTEIRAVRYGIFMKKDGQFFALRGKPGNREFVVVNEAYKHNGLCMYKTRAMAQHVIEDCRLKGCFTLQIDVTYQVHEQDWFEWPKCW